ncbi:hypothetical protein PM032_00550 [Halorubrum ezzemoulense]|uniref:hypothetical protein n=1 Tax=Halorubrum ezzemoulense TaxID=337243 RepID=UPI00232CEDF9|nr:hypothetical protein [Halorubrum ezzemoulense]MDB2269509.1 hypothetical protein [Halorubrum ezzemoulense]
MADLITNCGYDERMIPVWVLRVVEHPAIEPFHATPVSNHCSQIEVMLFEEVCSILNCVLWATKGVVRTAIV